MAAPSRALSSGSASEACAGVTTLSGASPLLRAISQQASANPTENSGCGCTESVVPPAYSSPAYGVKSEDRIVLVRAGDRDTRALDQVIARCDVVDVPPETPAFLRLAHRAAQRPRDQLMAEADADHRHLVVVGCAHECLERRDPVERVVDAGRGAGDEDRLQPFEIRQRLAGGNADGIEGDGGVGGADHLLEHLRIRSVEFALFRADEAGLDDGNVRHRCLSLRS